MMKTSLEMLDKDDDELFCQSAGEKLYQLTWSSLGSRATAELQEDMIRDIIKEVVRILSLRNIIHHEYNFA